MNYLIYMSTATSLLTDAELKQLLAASQANNLKNELTGMLLYSQGTFVQVLEGDNDKLEQTYYKIQTDKRHKNIIKIIEGTIDKPLFPNWSMGFKTVQGTEIAEFEAYINPKDNETWKFADENHPALIILKTFAETNQL